MQCPCACNAGGFCGGCGHAGCGGRTRTATRRTERPTPDCDADCPPGTHSLLCAASKEAQHRYSYDLDRCVCGGQVVFYDDGDADGNVGEGCEVAGRVWASNCTGDPNLERA
jgi:hypothetical protein